MNALMSFLLVVKTAALTDPQMPIQMNNDYLIQVIAFVACIWLVYLVLTPGKRRKIRRGREKLMF